MNDKVILAPSGELAIAIPLFRMHHNEVLTNLEGYHISLTQDKPLAYIIEVGNMAQVFSSDFVEKRCEFLGDL